MPQSLFLLLLFLPLLIRRTTANPTTPLSHTSHQSNTCINGPRPARCGDFCSFRLCNNNGNEFVLNTAPFVLLPEPNEVSSSPFICSTEFDLASVIQTGEARIFDSNRFVPISKWRPTGLNRPFPADALTSIPIRPLNVPGISRRKRSRGNQWRFLHNQCVILPILRYNVRTAPDRVEQRNSTGDINSCVAFRTTAPALHIRAEWDSSDDFDLLVEEPDGSAVDFNSPRSMCGRLLGDNFFEFCEADLPTAREDIVYFPGNNRRGLYQAELTHVTSCSEDPSNWNLRIIKEGVLFRRFGGSSKDGEITLVANRTFRV